MLSDNTQLLERTGTRAWNGAGATTKEVPYDYVATFQLTGKRTTRLLDVVNISIEGAFVAVAVGYSFIPAQRQPNPGAVPARPQLIANAQGLLAAIGGAVGVVGAAANLNAQATRIARFVNQTLGGFTDTGELAQQVVRRFAGIEFLYSIIDSGSGRELQNLPIHSLAGLGNAEGDRPFRTFARPFLFMPRSTVRIEIEELSQGPLYEGATLYFVLHGYKMLGYGTTG